MGEVFSIRPETTTLGDMTLADKIAFLAKRNGISQAAIERGAMLAENRLAKLKTKGELTASEILRLSKLLCVSAEYLIDDDVNDPNPRKTLNEQEITIISLFKSLRIDYDQLIQAMAGMARLDGTVVETAQPAKATPASGRTKRTV